MNEINESILSGLVCTNCKHEQNEHWFDRECHGVIIKGGNIWNSCNCGYFRNIIEIKIVLVEEIEIESFENQFFSCANCNCPDQTHVLLEGKCDNPYCKVSCEKFESKKELFIFK